MFYRIRLLGCLVIVLAFGVYWIFVVIRRLRSDIQEFREKDAVHKFAIALIWLVTTVIAFLLVKFTPYVARLIREEFRFL